MNINEFQTLSREEQLAWAGKFAGVDPLVFDGIHRTESGRGVYMKSPAGAEGHFGLMPNTRKVWEGRFGAAIDPNHFGQSLFAATHTLKENLGRFKNLPDALRAYNGGWDPRKWKNPETTAYAGKVLGSDDAPDAAMNASTLLALADAPAHISPAATLWDTPFRKADKPATPAKTPSAEAAALVALGAAAAPAPLAAPTFGAVNAAGKAVQDKDLAEAKAAEETSLLDASRAAASYGDPFVAVARMVFRDPEPVDPNFVPPEDGMKGKTEWQQRQLRAAGSEKEYNRLRFEQEDRQDQDDILFRNGTVFGIGASILAELPGAFATGGVASLGTRSVGLGASAAAAAGRKGAAIAGLAAEGVAGNVLFTAALDAAGSYQGSGQYALAAAGGLLTPLLGGRAIGREADRAADRMAAFRIAADAHDKTVKLAEQASKNLGPGHTRAEIQAEMARIDAEGVRADVSSHAAAVPEHRRFNVGEEADLADEGLPPSNATGQTAGGATSSNMEATAADAAQQPRADFKSADEIRSAFGFNAAAPWENKNVAAERTRLMETDPSWAAIPPRMTDGMTWDQSKRLKPGTYHSAELRAAMATDVELATAVRQAEQIAKEYLPGSKIIFGTGVVPGEFGSIMSIDRTHFVALKPGISADQARHTLTHELGHAIYHQHANRASPRVLKMIDEDWIKWINDYKNGDVKALMQRFAVTSDASPLTNGGRKPGFTPSYLLDRDEYMAEQFVTHIQNRMLKGDYGQMDEGVIQGIMKALHNVLKFWKGVLQGGKVPNGAGAEEFFGEVLRIGRMRNDKAAAPAGRAGEPVAAQQMTSASMESVGDDVLAFQNDPIAREYGLDTLPMKTPAERATAKQILSLYKRAHTWAQANPVDEKRLNTILSRFDSFDPTSNQMLRSANPVVRMVAAELLENGGGAAGRRSSAAVAKYMNERAIIGNVINELDDAFKAWHKMQPGVDRAREFLDGRKRVEFNRLVAEEIEQRRYPGQQTNLGDAVRAAADAVEQSFERARLMQADAKTVGWQALPESSRGYMPHRMRPEAVRALTNARKRAVHNVLMDQFVTLSGFDMGFADQLAARYLDTVQRRALGGFSAPMGLHSPGAADMVKEAIEAMGLSRPELDDALKRYASSGAGHTKKRLNLDLRQGFKDDDGTSFRLMDLFDTDMLSLVRSQSQRVSGEVALARHGVMGKAGITILRDAMGYGGDTTKAVKRELDAFDQVAAEFLGAPFGTQNKWVDRAMQANSVASLGGMGFNQLGELINVATTLGVKAAVANVTSAGRLLGELRALKRGERVTNPIIGSFEQVGGAEFGTDAYKMVFPMDLPDAPIHTMGADTMHAGDKLLRGAGHLQTKLSMWRAITSVQQRGVSEQVVHSIARILRDGKTDVTMADMGLSQELVARLQKDLPAMTKWEGNKLVEFDLTKATDMDAAHQLVQAVHRGVNQMIQGTFIGETGRYVHNSYLRLLTQFRTFSLTAVDKQWNRQAGNHGVGVALAMTVGAMSAAIPLYASRTYLASIGREDQEEYLERHLAFGAVARATTNYIATSGLAGDFLDALTAVTGTGAMTGGRSGTNTELVGNIVAPALGKVDKVWGALQDTRDGTDVHGLIKEMPLSRLPWLIPAINALGD